MCLESVYWMNGWASLVAQMVKNPPAMQETWVRSLGQEDSLEKRMATHSSILAWRIPWTEEPGGLQSMGLQRVRQVKSTVFSLHLDPRSTGKDKGKLWITAHEKPQPIYNAASLHAAKTLLGKDSEEHRRCWFKQMRFIVEPTNENLLTLFNWLITSHAQSQESSLFFCKSNILLKPTRR